MDATRECFFAEGVAYEYLLVRKPIRQIYLRVDREGQLRVSAPLTVTAEQLEALFTARLPAIRAARERLAALPPVPRLALRTGEVLPILGVPHTLTVEAGSRPRVRCFEGQLLLTVHNPENGEERARVLRQWLWERAREELTALCLEAAPRFAPTPAEPPALVFREMTSRWGVCYPARGSVTLNLRLILLPRPLAEYVVYHELAHFRHPDHSRAFWAWLGQQMPDCAARRRELRQAQLPQLPWGRA